MDAGWFEDPEGHGRGRRYWDGAAWTDHYEAPPPPAAHHGYSQPQAYSQPFVPAANFKVAGEKDIFLAVFLAWFFGPLGMLYSTIPGAIVMFFADVILGIVTLGIALIFLIPIGIIWAYVAAKGHNEKLRAQAYSAQPAIGHHVVAHAPVASAPAIPASTQPPPPPA